MAPPSSPGLRARLPESSLGYVYAALLLLRFYVAVRSPAYIHPDEYFQSAEPVLSDWLDIETVRTWEFDPAYPCRSMASLRLFNLPLLALVWGYKHCGSSPPAALLFLTQRLTAFCYSLIIDACVPSLVTFKSRRGQMLTRIILASNGAILAFSTRPFSNAIEAALLTLCLRCGHAIYQRAREWSQARRSESKTVLEGWSALSSLLGLFLSLGVFSRFTFALFALPLGLQYLYLAWDMSAAPAQRSGQQGAPLWRPIRALLLCSDAINGFLTGTLAHVFHDTLYYRSLLQAEERIDTSSAAKLVASLVKRCRYPPVVAPLNALAYNLEADNLAQHGLHPRWLHALVNAPMILGIAGWLGCLALAYRWVDTGGADIARPSARRHSTAPDTRASSEQTLLLATILVPLALLSVQPHQEPRFLLPLVVPMAPLVASLLCDDDAGNGQTAVSAVTRQPPDGSSKAAHQDASDASKTKAIPASKSRLLCRLFWTLQITQAAAMTLFFGFAHQAGVAPALIQLNEEVAALSKSSVSHASLPPWLGASHCGDRSEVDAHKEGGDLSITLHSWYTFMPPRHLLIPEAPDKAKTDVTVIDHGSLSVGSMHQRLASASERETLEQSRKGSDVHLLLAPTWAVASLQDEIGDSTVSPTVCLSLERIHSPHLDMDHLPETWHWIAGGRALPGGQGDIDESHGVTHWARRIREGFGLSVVRLRIR